MEQDKILLILIMISIILITISLTLAFCNGKLTVKYIPYGFDAKYFNTYPLNKMFFDMFDSSEPWLGTVDIKRRK